MTPEGGREMAVAPRPGPAAKRNPRGFMCFLSDAGRGDFGSSSLDARPASVLITS